MIKATWVEASNHLALGPKELAMTLLRSSADKGREVSERPRKMEGRSKVC